MMRDALPVLVLVLIAAAGCSTVQEPGDWSKPGVSTQQVTADDVECWRASKDAEWSPDLILGGVLDVVRVTLERNRREAAYGSCMRDKGYAGV